MLVQITCLTRQFVVFYRVVMNIKQTIKSLVLVIALSVGFVSIFGPSSSALDACDPATQSCCGGVETTVFTCSQTGQDKGACPDGTIIDAKSTCADGSKPDVVANTGVWGILLVAINILTAGIGIVAIGGIVYASILYTSAGGSQEQVKKAMGIITNVVIGVLAYALMYAVLNFLVPGGLFN